MTSSTLRKFEKHPHSWTFTSTPPPPLDIARVIYTSKKRGGGNFGPNVKKPTSWPKRGGPDPLDPPPPLGSATGSTHIGKVPITGPMTPSVDKSEKQTSHRGGVKRSSALYRPYWETYTPAVAYPPHPAAPL